MTIPPNIQVYVSDDEKELIKKASKEVSLNSSSFIRFVVLKEVKEILRGERVDDTKPD